MAFWMLENDGHNTPLVWKFRDQRQAEEYFAKVNKSYPNECSTPPVPGFLNEQLDGGGGWLDSNGTLWEVTDSPMLSVIDKTKDA